MLENDLPGIGTDGEGHLALSVRKTRVQEMHSIPIGDRLKKIILKTLYDELTEVKPGSDTEEGINFAIKAIKSCKIKED